MSCCTIAYVPSDYDIKDVVVIIGRAVGHPVKRSDSLAKGVRLDEDADVPKDVRNIVNFNQIIADSLMYGGWMAYGLTIQLDSRFKGKTWTRISASSSTEYLAILKRVVESTGGWFVPNDCKNKAIKFERPKPTMDKHRMTPEDGDEWHAYQDYLEGIKPVSFDDLKWARYESAYGSKPEKFDDWAKRIWFEQMGERAVSRVDVLMEEREAKRSVRV